MISPTKRRVDISLPIKTIELMDKSRGKSTRSAFIDTAIYFLIASVAIHEQDKQKRAEKQKQPKEKN